MTTDPYLVLCALVTIWWIITAAMLYQARKEAAQARLEVLRMARECRAQGYPVESTATPVVEDAPEPPPTPDELRKMAEAEAQKARVEELERQKAADLTAESEAGLNRLLRGKGE